MDHPVDQAQQRLHLGEVDAAIRIAEAAARSGDAEALALLATWRLIGHPLARDLALARSLLAQAAEARHGWSGLALIALTANGSGAPPDWQAALKLLQKTAEWNAEAAEHLRLMQAMDINADGSPTREVKAETISEAPLVQCFRGFLTRDECAHIARAGQDLLEPSMIVDPQSGKLLPHPIRTSAGATLGPTRESLPIQAIQRRIAAAAQIPVAQGEPFSLLHYAPGQQYRLHVDTLPEPCNQRIATCILYLNEGYAGGETYFEESGTRFRGHIGDALFFLNVDAAGRPNSKSRHAGLPVVKGTKWIATRWLRATLFDPWTAGGGNSTQR
jgi:prolyl 4-hydroxylase